MEEALDANKLTEEDDSPSEVYEFKYNLINTPWDDRTNRSKVSIIVLLVSIFLAIAGLVINGLIIQYRGFSGENQADNFEINCNLVKMENYKFIARIFSVETKELLCVGAVVSWSSILANHVCVRSGPVRIRLGSPTDPRCRKNFAADVREKIYHDGVVAHHLVLLITDENIRECAQIIPIGLHLDLNGKTYIIGRPFYSGNSLARRRVTISGRGNCSRNSDGIKLKRINQKSTICVQDYARCPVRAGDLLVQGMELFGLASTSVHRNDQNKIVSFADLTLVREELLELDVQVITEKSEPQLLRNNDYGDTDGKDMVEDNMVVTDAPFSKHEATEVIDDTDIINKNAADLRNSSVIITDAQDVTHVTPNSAGYADYRHDFLEELKSLNAMNITIIQSGAINNTAV